MTDEKPRNRAVSTWETVAVTALPLGWRNVYYLGDGKADTEHCPAVLLQELRETEVVRDVATGGSPKYVVETVSRTVHEPPYETRAVFACQDGSGGLDPAADVGNYLATIGPGDDIPDLDPNQL